MNWQTLWNEGGASGLGYSEIEAYLRCPKEYQYGAVRKLVKPMTVIPDYFASGAFVHAGRARWFASQFSTSDETWLQIQADMTKVREEFSLPCNESAYSDALRWVQEYVEHYGVREKPKIVAVEHMLGPVELAEGYPATNRTARLDDFGFYPESGSALAIGECKTTAGGIQDVANQYTMHGQPALQNLLWKLAPQGEAMYGASAGMVLDVIKKGYAGKRCEFARLFVPVPARLMEITQREFSNALASKAHIGWNSQPERRLTSCTRLIGKARVACPFRDICLHGRAGAIGFVTEDGQPVSSWKPDEQHAANPWD